MFKNLLRLHIKDLRLWKIALLFTTIVFSILIVVYFFTSKSVSNKTSIGFIVLTLFVILGNWFTNVRLPISRARKQKYDSEIMNSYKETKTNLSKYQYSELYLFAKGLSFTLSSLPVLIISIIFTVI